MSPPPSAGKKRVYVIEDDPDVGELLRRSLCDYGFAPELFATGAAARAALRREKPDLCVVDLGLPDMDGLGLVRSMWDEDQYGVIILTGRGDLSDRVLGLELGADDYIVKPFEPRELVARINSVIRRRQRSRAAADHGGFARFAGWRFDVGGLTLTNPQGREERLTAAEALLLTALLRAPKRVLSREQLQDLDGDRDDAPFDRSIDVRVSRIRKKLEADPKDPKLIKTVYGAGYLFAADVSWSQTG